MMTQLRARVCVTVTAGTIAVASWSLHAQIPTTVSGPALRKPDRATTAALEEKIPELMKEATVPGMSLALIRDGKTYWLYGFGVKDAKTGQPVTEDTIFEAASLSKPVFAYAVLKLVDQGKLDLDRPLSQYLPKPYSEGDERLEKITARYVLSHRTGFPNWRGKGKPLTIRFTPGERFSYSGEGFVYLQKVVEQVTGKALNDFMTETVFVPLGMASSSYVWRADYDARTATGHDGAGEIKEKGKPKEANAAASLHTTAKDYAAFVEAVLNGKGLKPGTMREMERPQIAVDPECTNCTERETAQLSQSVFWGLMGHSENEARRVAVALGRQRMVQVLRGGLPQTENGRGDVHGRGERAGYLQGRGVDSDWRGAAGVCVDQA